MNKQLKQQVQTALNIVGYDKITFHRDNTVTIRRGFFYQPAGQLAGYVEKVNQQLQATNLVYRIEDQGTHWNNWPRDSFYTVTIKVFADTNAIIDERAEYIADVMTGKAEYILSHDERYWRLAHKLQDRQIQLVRHTIHSNEERNMLQGLMQSAITQWLISNA